jgi:hypothetical protein
MRLREFDSDSDEGSALDVLRVLRGLANKDNQPSTLPFLAVLRIISQFNLGISTPDGLIKWANDQDPDGNVLSISQDSKGNIVLNTNVKNPKQVNQLEKPKGPSVASMASANTDLSPKI